MGATNTKPLEQWTPGEVATACNSLGSAYAAYLPALESNGVNGALLASLALEDLPDTFESLDITNRLHQKVLSQALDQLKHQAQEEPAPAANAASPSDSEPAIATLNRDEKRFDAFLSHFKSVSSFTTIGSDRAEVCQVTHCRFHKLQPRANHHLRNVAQKLGWWRTS